MSTIRAWRAAAVAAGAWLAALACTPDAAPAEGAFDPPALARPAALRPLQALEYTLAPASHVALRLEGRQQRLEGELPVAAGRLWIDPRDLGATRAELTFDLAAIRLWDSSSNPSGSGPTGATLTEQSLDWLQVARRHRGGGRPELRYARFTLLSIGSSSSNDLDAAPAVRSGPSAVVARRVRLRASGELELHGHRLPQTASLDATFEWTAPAAASGPPIRVLLETTEPLLVDLLAHGIVPRNAQGERLAQALAELRRPPSRPLQVRARWRAELADGAAARDERPTHSP